MMIATTVWTELIAIHRIAPFACLKGHHTKRQTKMKPKEAHRQGQNISHQRHVLAVYIHTRDQEQNHLRKTLGGSVELWNQLSVPVHNAYQ